MKHKWHKEIKAWANGAEIEQRHSERNLNYDNWEVICNPKWIDDVCEYRIKPQPKEEYTAQDFFRDFKEIHLASKEFNALFDKPQPKENKFAHIPYWLCCGSLDIRHHSTLCSEAKAGYPERCRFGTVEEHQKRMEKPKEPQYLYVYRLHNSSESGFMLDKNHEAPYAKCVGKIKLEDEQ